MAWFEGWVNEQAIKDGHPFVLLGIAGAVLRSINNPKAKWKAYVVGVIGGAILSSVLTFLIGPSSLPVLLMGGVCFASGFFNKEMAMMLGKAGLLNAQKIFDNKDENEDGDSGVHNK